MRQKDVEFLKTRMQILQNSTFEMVNRVCNMLCLHFLVEDKSYALHIQSAFRFTKDKNILCANLDMYEPKPELLNDPSFSYETFNWDIQGENYLDNWGRTEGRVLKNAHVKNISVSNFGDLSICFDNDIQLEVFNNALYECWRFFEEDSDEDHTVILGNEIEK